MRVLISRLGPARATLWIAAVLGGAALSVLFASPGAAKTTGPTFAPPVYVDQQLAGGEPEVFADTLHGTLVYTAHEGTTHLYRDGIVMSPWGLQLRLELLQPGQRLDVARRRDELVPRPLPRQPGPTSPAINTGFSDPDLTQDAGGRLYSTGIDSSTTPSSRRSTAGRPGTKGTAFATTATGRGSPDLDCQPGHIHAMEASLTGAASKKPQKWIADAAGRPVHIGLVCQGGTLCVATGQDRRFGDYFTNTLDARGCALIATGDTRLTDPTTGGPSPTARPLFIRQNGGPRLIGAGTCS